ncbi:hypothetical protein FNV43_RR08213 [Rhamnella rubrinervis]|uniref:Uncharacterized protein n=1 Tax=Rhamnella rubrinervis TaxID=2594499 RepID=A0A8K0HG47_9ROSA|nr:hypothetical protein FNV43_RR08213 [Rhamnella rubrinervis]
MQELECTPQRVLHPSRFMSVGLFTGSRGCRSRVELAAEELFRVDFTRLRTWRDYLPVIGDLGSRGALNYSKGMEVPLVYEVKPNLRIVSGSTSLDYRNVIDSSTHRMGFGG